MCIMENINVQYINDLDVSYATYAHFHTHAGTIDRVRTGVGVGWLDYG